MVEQRQLGEQAHKLLEDAARSALCAGHTDLAAQAGGESKQKRGVDLIAS